MGLQGGRQNPIWQLSEPGNGCRSGKRNRHSKPTLFSNKGFTNRDSLKLNWWVYSAAWIAATYTKETGNLWTNPERTCHHADPAVTIYAGQTKSIALKTFIVKGDLEQILKMVDEEMKSK